MYPIKRNELVITVNSTMYHNTCFKCSDCHSMLQYGDSFRLQNDKVLCKRHFSDVIELKGKLSKAVVNLFTHIAF